jgi:hypothetical protein
MQNTDLTKTGALPNKMKIDLHVFGVLVLTVDFRQP